MKDVVKWGIDFGKDSRQVSLMIIKGSRGLGIKPACRQAGAEPWPWFSAIIDESVLCRAFSP